MFRYSSTSSAGNVGRPIFPALALSLVSDFPYISPPCHGSVDNRFVNHTKLAILLSIRSVIIAV
jgi:hypothetical protein